MCHRRRRSNTSQKWLLPNSMFIGIEYPEFSFDASQCKDSIPLLDQHLKTLTNPLEYCCIPCNSNNSTSARWLIDKSFFIFLIKCCCVFTILLLWSINQFSYNNAFLWIPSMTCMDILNDVASLITPKRIINRMTYYEIFNRSYQNTAWANI